MSENKAVNAVKHEVKSTDQMNPLDSLPGMDFDTDEQLQERQHYGDLVVTELLDPKKQKYASYGYVTIEYQRDGEWSPVTFRIRSLTDHVQQRINEEFGYTKPTTLNQVLNEETGEYEDDPMDPNYIDWLMNASAKLTAQYYQKFLHAFVGRIGATDTEEIVWDSRNPEMQDKDRALEALHALEIPTAQLKEIADAIDHLCVKEAVEEAEQEKK